ncbi:MAG: type II and III secretion system protein family protein [Geminicoccaceae bacterium]
MITTLPRRLAVKAALVLTLTIGAIAPGHAQEPQSLDIEVGKGQLVRLDRPAVSIFIANPEIADIQTQSQNVIYVFGKRAGTTSLYAVDATDQVILSREVKVDHNLSGLGDVVETMFPGADIGLASIEGGIILSGAVANPVQAEELRLIATRFLGAEENLINRVAVNSPTQVNLRVQIAEVSRSALKQLGVSWQKLFSFTDIAFGLVFGRDFVDGADTIVIPDDGSGFVPLTYSRGDVQIQGLLNAIEEEGLGTVLAQPNLTALSGETASFLAGGEFPIAVGNSDGEIEIEFKQFGVQLAFTPTVLSNERISMRVRPEVSALTETGAITLNSITVPALATRRAETTVELGSGQSFAIGGLITNETSNDIRKFPGLGDVPILGALFRSSDFQRDESELVIVVTPYLVEPIRTAEVQAPTDNYRSPTDIERVLEGRLFGSQLRTGRSDVLVDGRRLYGNAGFILD